MNILKKTTTSLITAFALIFSPMMLADVSGSVGFSSDYFWRGQSQNAGEVALDLGIEASHNRFYGGVWASQVDFGNDAEIEYDIYGGVNLVSTGDFDLDLGFIQYNWDEVYEDMEEVYLSASYKMVGVTYYKDRDSKRRSYVEASLDIQFVDVVDMSITYGLLQDGDKTYSIKFAKNLSDQLVLSGMIVKPTNRDWNDVRIDRDSIAVGIHYNF